VDPYSGFDLDFGNEKFKHPFNSDEPKRRFVMSKWERLKINKFIQSMKKGWMKTIAQQKEEEER